RRPARAVRRCRRTIRVDHDRGPEGRGGGQREGCHDDYGKHRNAKSHRVLLRQNCDNLPNGRAPQTEGCCQPLASTREAWTEVELPAGIHSLNHRLWTSVIEGWSRLSMRDETTNPQEESEAGSGSVMAR